MDVQKIYKEYHRSVTLRKDQNLEVAKIQKESAERLTRVHELQASIEALAKQLEDPSLSDSKKQSLYTERNVKLQDAIALDRERQEYLKRRQLSFNEKAAAQARAILEEIRLLVVEKAKTDDVDYVFDKSAGDALQGPFFIHTPDAADITGELLEQLNRGAPAATKESNASPEPAAPLEPDQR